MTSNIKQASRQKKVLWKEIAQTQFPPPHTQTPVIKIDTQGRKQVYMDVAD